MLQRDEEAKEKAPEVLKQNINNNSSKSTNKTPSGSRSFSSSARRNSLELRSAPSSDLPPPDVAQFRGTKGVGLEDPDPGLGHKFPIPDLKPLGQAVNFKKRYDPVVEQVTRSLMKDGKLSRAQKVCKAFHPPWTGLHMLTSLPRTWNPSSTPCARPQLLPTTPT